MYFFPNFMLIARLRTQSLKILKLGVSKSRRSQMSILDREGLLLHVLCMFRVLLCCARPAGHNLGRCWPVDWPHDAPLFIGRVYLISPESRCRQKNCVWPRGQTVTPSTEL